MKLYNKIGTGMQANVYLYNNSAIKVFRQGYDKASVFFEAMINSMIESVGVPMAKVHEVLNIDNKLAIKMDYIKGESLHKCLLSDIGNINNYVDIMVDLQLKVHSKEIWLPLSFKDKLKDRIIRVMSIDESKKSRLLNMIGKLPEGNALCHGDFHGYNIIKQGTEYYIIDWVDASKGCADADVCRTYLLCIFYFPEIVELYLESYCVKACRQKEDVLKWLPVIAAARLSDNNEGEKEKIFEILKDI